MADVEVATCVVDHEVSVPDVEIRPVEDRPGYYVGRDGSGWRLDDDGQLVQVRVHRRQCDEASLIFVTRRGKKVGSIHVARAVLKAFVGPPPHGYVARHWPDPDPSNNHVENLRWGSRGAYRHRAAKSEGEAGSHVEENPIPPKPPRFVGPFAGLLDADRKRRRRLMKSRETVATYREAQDEAGHRPEVRPAWRPSPWWRSE